MNQSEEKPFFVCRNKETGQYLWIAFEVWEHKKKLGEAYPFSSIPVLQDFFEWQGRDLSKYDVLQVEYMVTKLDRLPPFKYGKR